jgi:DNA-binding NarL/FixJ family response regulator
MINLRLLLVDDHPIIIEAYCNSLQQFETANEGYKFHIDKALCCDSALVAIKENTYDIAFLDLRLPASKNGKYKSGEDIAKLLKRDFKHTKIIIVTGHYDVLLLGNLLQNLNPDGLLFKGDVDSNTCSEALVSVSFNIPFYSSTVLKLLRQKISSNVVLSKTDKLLLYELAKGTRTKDLTKVLPLSIGGVEKRKRHLKEVFDSTRKDDSELIKAAIDKGFI